MGNSCVTGSGRSNQGQHHESNRAQTTFKWTIDGFSSILDKGNGWTNSCVFQIRGLYWYLKLNPRDTKIVGTEEYVSLKLVLAQSCVRSGMVVEASFKFLIYDQLYGKHHEQYQVSHNFQSTSTTSGTSCMIPLKTLKEKSSGFLVDNCCIFGVEFIRVVPVEVNDVSETLFVQKINNICSDPQVYNWNIDDFFVLKNGSTSPEFELCGHKWFITIHPSGYRKGNHLSLFLNMKASDTLEDNSANLVEFSISIKGQETGKYRKSSGSLALYHKFPAIDRVQMLRAGIGAVVRSSPLVPRGPGFEPASLHCTLQGQVPVLKKSIQLGMEKVHIAGRFQGLVKWLSREDKVLH